MDAPPPRPPPRVGKEDKKTYNPDDDSSYYAIYIPKFAFWVLWTLMIIGAGVGVGYGFFLFTFRPDSQLPSAVDSIGLDNYMLFRQHDRNDDGKLSLDEFEPLAHMLNYLDFNTSFEYDDKILETDKVLSVFAGFTPLNISTMTKDFDTVFAGNLDSLHGLKKWKLAAKERVNFAARHFKMFLPPHGQMIPGTVYDIVPMENNAPLSSNRYYPPMVDERYETLHRLLAMLHDRPFLHMRFPPQGTVGCVKAVNDKHVHLMFRIHAEFQLNTPPYYPFWFTPGQFTGHVVMTHDASHIEHFHMYVPAQKKLNVDMEWMNGPREAEQMEVDIGHMAQMQLISGYHSVPAFDNGEDKRKQAHHSPTPTSEYAKQLEWTEQVSDQECRDNMEKRFYPFKEVKYHHFSEAFRLAREANKLVHLVLLWGALDDQSC